MKYSNFMRKVMDRLWILMFLSKLQDFLKQLKIKNGSRLKKKLILKKIGTLVMNLSKMNRSTKYVSLGQYKNKRGQALQKWNKVGCKIMARNHKLENNQTSSRRVNSWRRKRCRILNNRNNFHSKTKHLSHRPNK